MIVAAWALDAVWKGTRSIWARAVASLCIIGSDRCESTCVSPWPGKCLAEAATPALVRPRQTAATYLDTSSGSGKGRDKRDTNGDHLTQRYRHQKTARLRERYDRASNRDVGTNRPMTGFRGSLFTSATGLYVQFKPTSFSSRADASDTRSARSGEPVAPRAIAPGLPK